MHNLVIVYSFAYQHQLLTVRAQMEAEGIETFTENEFTVQVDPLYSTAVGGIKLLVHQADAERAAEILLAHGFNPNPVAENSHLFELADALTRVVPVIGKLEFSIRIILLTVIFTLVTSLGIYLLVT